MDKGIKQKITVDTGEDGRIAVRENAADSVPHGLSAVLLDEAATIIVASSNGFLRAELDLVLKGLSIQLQETDDPAAMGLTSRLLARLPDEREKIIGRLGSLCSEEQMKTLSTAER